MSTPYRDARRCEPASEPPLPDDLRRQREAVRGPAMDLMGFDVDPDDHWPLGLVAVVDGHAQWARYRL